MATALEAGKTMAEGILAKLPESLRADFQRIVATPEASDALTELGARTLAQGDYSRQLDELRAKETTLQQDYENLQAWYQINKGTIDKAAALEAEVTTLRGGKQPPAPAVVPPPAHGLGAEEFQKELAARERAAATYLNAVSKLGLEHYQRFNEVLDPNELMALAEAKHVSIFDAYNAKFGDRLAAKAAEAKQAEIEKIVGERLAEERKKDASQPFPLRHQAPSVLDVLETKDGPAQHTLDTAVAEFDRLQASRG